MYFTLGCVAWANKTDTDASASMNVSRRKANLEKFHRSDHMPRPPEALSTQASKGTIVLFYLPSLVATIAKFGFVMLLSLIVALKVGVSL